MHKSLRWLFALALVLIIIHFSRQPFSKQDLSPVLVQYQWLINIIQQLPSIDFSYNGHMIRSHENVVGFIQFVIRKLVHLGLYGLFGMSVFYAASGGLRFRWKPWVLSLMIVAFTAIMDEVNQMAMAGRTGCLEDILLDITGFLLITAIIHFLRSLSKVLY